jgi:ABC-type polysaccharide transport system permease subunit
MDETVTVRKKWADGFRFWSDREDLLGPLFLFPAVVYIIALVGIPFIIAIAYSVTDVTVGNTSLNFVGPQNFQAILKTPQFTQSLRNTIMFTIVSQIIILVLANILALVLSTDFRGKWFARFLIMLPGRLRSHWERSAGYGCLTQNSVQLTGCCATCICWVNPVRSWGHKGTFSI